MQELQENTTCYFKKKKKPITLYFIGNHGWIGLKFLSPSYLLVFLHFDPP
jgi:hypothetical protein